ncbi:unnamed protein product, partial [Chrysoparadoxa australica]
VAVRVRPFSAKEKEAGAKSIISMKGTRTSILDPAYFDSSKVSQSSPEERLMWERNFTFDHSFWSHDPSSPEHSTQKDVYQELGGFLVDNAIQGYNAALLAYGQTGSGKTYTMLGDGSIAMQDGGEGPGVIPRLCMDLMKKAKPGMKQVSCEVGEGGSYIVDATLEVSFCEIYNENVKDLFTTREVGHGHNLKVREHPETGAFVEGLSVQVVKNFAEINALLGQGMLQRTTAETSMNQVSSRSHAIFTLYLKATVASTLQSEGEGNEDFSTRVSKIALIDLAGSERANTTGASGERLREASNINKSLSTLGDVIKALAKKTAPSTKSLANGSQAPNTEGNEVFVPYRNSVLTWLLKDSLGGNSKTVMLAAISPVASSYNETMSTLRYIERAKSIVNTARVNDGEMNPLVLRLRAELSELREQLVAKENESLHSSKALLQDQEVRINALEALAKGREEALQRSQESLTESTQGMAKLRREHGEATAALNTELQELREEVELMQSMSKGVEDSHRAALATLRSTLSYEHSAALAARMEEASESHAKELSDAKAAGEVTLRDALISAREEREEMGSQYNAAMLEQAAALREELGKAQAVALAESLAQLRDEMSSEHEMVMEVKLAEREEVHKHEMDAIKAEAELNHSEAIAQATASVKTELDSQHAEAMGQAAEALRTELETRHAKAMTETTDALTREFSELEAHLMAQQKALAAEHQKEIEEHQAYLAEVRAAGNALLMEKDVAHNAEVERLRSEAAESLIIRENEHKVE